MNRENKIELAKMQSLMERMDKHYTRSEVMLINESILEVDRNNTVNIDQQVYNLSSPEELIQTLSKEDFTPKKGWYVTLGYVEKVTKLGNKNIKGSIDKFDDTTVDAINNSDFQRLKNIVNNPTYIEKGVNKGKIKNPYMPDSYTNYIVEASIIRLMYGRNDEYLKRKELVKQDLTQFQNDNPEDVQHYMDDYNNNPRNVNAGRTMIDFVNQSFDDARSDKSEHVPGTNIYKKDDDYEFRFNTPKKVFQKIKTQYFLITDEDNIEVISNDEAKMYIDLYGVVASKTIPTDPVVAKVKQAIEDAKSNRFQGDIWGRYNLKSVFLMNFTPEGDRGQKLQYYNPDAIVEFLQGRELKSGVIPSKFTSKGLFKPHFDKMRD